FLVRIAPSLALAGLISGLGHSIGKWIPDAGWIYLLGATWGFFVGMYILEQEPVWNTLLFLGFAMSSGALLRGIDYEGVLSRVWLTLIGGISASFVWGLFSGPMPTRAAGYLFPLTILYLLGWILLSILSLPSGWLVFWAGLGLMLFLLIAVSIFNKGKMKGGEGSPVPLASDLFVVGFNFFWLAAVFWGALS
ncbi:MAG: hypothetical protein KGY39_06215, partial [Anaerolineales bacterium]|nr:hypothetical protein [Anaerolineales bacterium]